jgi:hypothetical protein
MYLKQKDEWKANWHEWENATTLLYLAKDQSPQVSLWGYFDGVIEEGDWSMLESLARCPAQLKIVPLAHELSVELVERVLSLLAGQGYDYMELNILLATLDGNSQYQVGRHLETCSTCKEAFVRVLESRLAWLYRTVCPPLSRLAEYARDTLQRDKWTKRHLASCTVCSTKIQMLLKMATPGPLVVAPAPVETSPVSFFPSSRRILQPLVIELDKMTARLRALPTSVAVSPDMSDLGALMKAFLQDLGALQEELPTRSTSSGIALQLYDWRPPPKEGSTRNVRKASASTGKAPNVQPITTTITSLHNLEVSITWSPLEEHIWIRTPDATAETAREEFVMELLAEEVLVWSGRSAQGVLQVPVRLLAESVSAGANRLLLRNDST